jgi:hypothetical protein
VNLIETLQLCMTKCQLPCCTCQQHFRCEPAVLQKLKKPQCAACARVDQTPSGKKVVHLDDEANDFSSDEEFPSLKHAVNRQQRKATSTVKPIQQRAPPPSHASCFTNATDAGS